MTGGTVGLVITLSLVAGSEVRADGDLLTLVQRIGPGWSGAQDHWMSLVAFSPDGTRIASDAPAQPDDRQVLTLWSFPEGRLVRKIAAGVTGLSPNLAYYSTRRGIWDVGSGQRLSIPSEPGDLEAVFSADSRTVAEYWAGSGRIKVFTLPDGVDVGAVPTHPVFGMALSPDGTTLAVGHWDGISLWNIAKGKREAKLQGVGRYVIGLAFSPNGKRLVAGTDSGGVQIWDVEQRHRLQEIALGGGQVSAPAFSPDGRWVAVGVYGTGKAFVLDSESGVVLGEAKASDLGCGSVAFSPDGKFLITPSTGGLPLRGERPGAIKVFSVRGPPAG